MKTRSLFLAVCAVWSISLADAASSAQTWRTEKVSVGALEVQSVHLRRWKNGVLVSGTVNRPAGFGYPADMGYRLRIDVLDAGGALAVSQLTEYLPRPVFITYRGIPGRSTYAAYLHRAPASGSIIRVSSEREAGSK